MRELEHDIIRRIVELRHGILGVGLNSQIKLNHFFGVELEDFPRELAVLSMYIAAHQMNIEFEKEFGKKLSIIPLIDIPTIFRENSARVDWNDICPNNGIEEIYVIGNPPYKGADKQTQFQRDDFKTYFKDDKISGNADYIAIWFIKGARYISNTNARLAFVSTNSVCQGEHVGLMFPKIFDKNIEIGFAWQSFKWSNNAKNQAGVTVIVLGLQNRSSQNKIIYNCETAERVEHISPYLVPGDDLIVYKRSKILSDDFPEMAFGSMPRSKALVLTKEERDEILSSSPIAEKYIRVYMGAEDYINSKNRYCIWVEDKQYSEADKMTILHDRFEIVREERSKSKAASTKKFADKPYRFVQISYKNATAIIVPRVSSERREYIPMGLLDGSIIISDAAFAIYEAEPWLFALLESKIHMAWIKTVCGKLKTDYRYSSTLGYNTFPCPPLTTLQKEKLNQSARAILFARANHPDLTLADMYDPDKMPDDLRRAHEGNDILVDKLYGSTPFQNDEARLTALFKLYEEMTGRE